MKWLDLMCKDNMSIFALSTLNEPLSAKQIIFQAMYWPTPKLGINQNISVNIIVKQLK